MHLVHEATEAGKWMERFVVNLIDATRFKHFLSLLDVIKRLTLFLYDVEEERIRLLSLQV